MLRTICVFLIFIFSSLVSVVSMHTLYAETSTCDMNTSSGAVEFLTKCSSQSSAYAVTEDMGEGTDGIKSLIINVSERVIQFGALFAIGAIVFSGIRYTISAGDDEKLKSAKNTAIYAIIGLILLLTAFPLVDILVNFIYNLGV